MSLILATQVCRRCASTGVRNPTVDPQTKQSKALLDRILRVDHAGEYGAVRIYQGQMAVLGRTSVSPVLREMHEGEVRHLRTFERLLPKHRVRPTALLPLWNVAGYMLGAGSALLGKEGAMACTVAVETAIGEHYDSQIRALLEDDPEKHKDLLKVIRRFRDDELQHLDTGLEHDAEKAPYYDVMTNVIKVGCKGAIWLSERV